MIANIWLYVKALTFLKILLTAKSICAASSSVPGSRVHLFYFDPFRPAWRVGLLRSLLRFPSTAQEELGGWHQG